MKAIFDRVSNECSKLTTKCYSTSFSLGIRFLNKELRTPIYGIYGFVRFADEIVDTFHEYNKAELLEDFKKDTHKAIDDGISLNPILNSFQQVVCDFNIGRELIDTFLASMKMDLEKNEYSQEQYETYILGSAEVVGLMCLKVFTEGDQKEYERLKPEAMSLGSAFQKINFLRDLNDDFIGLGRAYFPGIDMDQFNEVTKKNIEKEIETDFAAAYAGIFSLSKKARFGVYVAYVYYYRLFKKIQKLPAENILEKRIRIPNNRKFRLFVGAYLRHSLNLV